MASIDQIQIPSGSGSATYDIDAKTVNGKTVESDVPPSAKFTDTKVVQTPTTANGDYRVIFSGTADDTSHTEQVRKNGDFTYNPDSTELKITKSFSSGGVTGTRTTTHAGYGLDIEEYVGSTLWSSLGLRSGDITLTNKTWDGTNASLATAISAIKQSLTDSRNYPTDSTELLIGKRNGLNLYRKYLHITNVTVNISTPLLLSSVFFPTGAGNVSISDKSMIITGSLRIPANSMHSIVYVDGSAIYWRQSWSSSATWELQIWVEYTKS